MDLMKFHAIYFNVKKDLNSCTLTEKTGCNYIHITLIAICFLCCIINLPWFVIILLMVYVVSMLLKNCIFVKIYKSYAKKTSQLEFYGSRYSFKEPKTYTIVKKRKEE